MGIIFRPFPFPIPLPFPFPILDTRPDHGA